MCSVPIQLVKLMGLERSRVAVTAGGSCLLPVLVAWEGRAQIKSTDKYNRRERVQSKFSYPNSVLGNYFLATKVEVPCILVHSSKCTCPYISRGDLKATYRHWWWRHWSLDGLLSVSLPRRPLWLFISWFSNDGLQLLQFFIFDPKLVLHLQLLRCYTTLLPREGRKSMKYLPQKHE